MPGHFTHIYTARRVSDYLLTGKFPDWPQAGSAVFKFGPQKCGQVMRDWEKFTAIGAVGPDLFYFSQDYNNPVLGPLTDELMLALATYYFFDFAKENDYEPLLIILDQVNSTMAGLLRFLIKLQKIWQAFVDGWNQTIGPIVADITNLADDLTGGLLSEFGVVLDELKTALKTLAEEELLTYKDIFTLFDTCVQKGFDEQLFLLVEICANVSEKWSRWPARKRATRSAVVPSSSIRICASASVRSTSTREPSSMRNPSLPQSTMRIFLRP